ncbi:3-deoxy-8-phosphooctulonate synthase [Clostridium sp. OM02-18AC]|nr:3-deoxy-8-phosphooctulonate synthase [Clostridium sp. OM02-18AC]
MLMHIQFMNRKVHFKEKGMDKLLIIAGPCVIESEENAMLIAEKMKQIVARLGVDYYYKASFDKANRTSLDSYRGPGIEAGLRILKKIRDTYNLKICTDIHEPWQAELAAEVCDIIQIPAFLCRQTDLLVAAAKTGKIVNVKKAQFLAPWDMKNVVEKIEKSGNKNIMLCERGTSFGYNTLIVDMTGIIELKKLGYPVVMDATHSVQKPGGLGTKTGGNREYVEPLAKAAVAVGADALFFEVHPDPDYALSDGPNMVELNQFESLLKRVIRVYNAVH